MIALLLSVAALATSASPPPEDIRRSIGQAGALVSAFGEPLWPSYGGTPLEVDYIEPDREVLFCHAPAPGFTPLGRDALSGCTMQARPRQLAVDLSAEGDFLPGSHVIAMGTPAALQSTRIDWILTLVHEGFHQYQHTLPGWQAAVDRLGLARGSDAAWMLDFPFPYADPKVAAAFTAMTASAGAFLIAGSPTQARSAIAAYVQARRAAQATVSAADWRYYEFQIGQEGIARWTETAVATAAGRADKAMAQAATERRQGLAVSLRAIDRQGLAIWKRSVFYVLGPIEAEMLQSLGRPWRRIYLRDPFSFGDQLDKGEAG